jgi:hypothetical protein
MNGQPEEIFVFGSNLAGIHGAGAALHARRYYGARLGAGVGRTGNAYGIPTKDHDVQTSLSLTTVKAHVDDFLRYAQSHPELRFRLTAIGCGLAGFTVEQIAPLMCNAPNNVRFPPEFRAVLEHKVGRERFWSYEEVA